MHKTAAQTRMFFEIFLPEAEGFPHDVDVVIAPPFTALAAAHLALHNQSRIALGAQNVHWESAGAFTGEISVPMLVEHGVRYVIVGHSERRALFGELDSNINLKIRSILEAGLTPIVAVGETDDEHQAGMTDERVISQTRAAFEGLTDEQLQNVVLAYEPIWAIGTGKNCDPVEANRVMGAIRHCIDALTETPILYGGSMKADNVAAYMAQSHINGGLVGGASLDPSAFAALVRNAHA